MAEPEPDVMESPPVITWLDPAIYAPAVRSDLAGRSRNPLHPITAAIRRWWRLWLSVVALVPLCFYAAQLVLLRIRFGHWPNYVTFYDWPANVLRIIQHTPSLRDTLTLIQDEWLFETGYLNSQWGPRVAEWSLTIIPEHLIFVCLLGAMLATNLVLILEQKPPANMLYAPCVGAATGIGGSLLGLANVTLTWALCCGSPNWAVALTFLGFGSTAALWLVPYGPLLGAIGFLLLLVPPVLLLRGLPRA
jgi:hypothetical protein